MSSCRSPSPRRRKAIGVMTSGGDASGMNAAINAVFEKGTKEGFRVYFIKRGFLGLINGEIVRAELGDVRHWDNKGGTFIKTARSPDFKEDRAYRVQAAEHMIKHGICNLVVIGGDGSLMGANLLYDEWKSYLEELFNKKIITDVQMWNCRNLMVVGIVSSIDNDFPCTDMTLGADSALTRIHYCLSAIRDTAMSHERTFVVEVMGRNCGYLALRNGLKFKADWTFIPECPPGDGWEERMFAKMTESRASGQDYNLVIVSEHAKDRFGNRIDVHQIGKMIRDRLGHDVRTIVLGHVQRGGAPTEFDIQLGKEFGRMAIDTFLEAKVRRPGKFALCLKDHEIASHQLDTCLAAVLDIKIALDELRFEDALAKRGRKFNKYVRALKRQIPLMKPLEIVEEVIVTETPAVGVVTISETPVREVITAEVNPATVEKVIE